MAVSGKWDKISYSCFSKSGRFKNMYISGDLKKQDSLRNTVNTNEVLKKVYTINTLRRVDEGQSFILKHLTWNVFNYQSRGARILCVSLCAHPFLLL